MHMRACGQMCVRVNEFMRQRVRVRIYHMCTRAAVVAEAYVFCEIYDGLPTRIIRGNIVSLAGM